MLLQQCVVIFRPRDMHLDFCDRHLDHVACMSISAPPRPNPLFGDSELD
jgi:hypothetical protein